MKQKLEKNYGVVIDKVVTENKPTESKEYLTVNWHSKDNKGQFTAVQDTSGKLLPESLKELKALQDDDLARSILMKTLEYIIFNFKQVEIK